jgi:hypothetical protein
MAGMAVRRGRRVVAIARRPTIRRRLSDGVQRDAEGVARRLPVRKAHGEAAGRCRNGNRLVPGSR